ncbi:dihydrofolate reductase family protein [Kocuria palustris]|uniref:dihydrofolate reductase family protein n=1 Tax=Kocuria palustris TaxID=71999 RepID=UPI002042CFB6|nr:dihydrofolate reductase family protein [Kocuria palustris]
MPAGDHLADPDAQMHYFAVDRSASLAWDRGSFSYFDVDAHIVELILGGGGTLNWSMVRDGLCNEVSIVMMPLADGETDTASLFEASGEHSSPLPIGFSLKGVEPLEDGSLWLRYDVTGPVEQEQS